MWQYVLEQNGNAIGDFNMIDGTTGLIIERDDGEGTADKACAAGTKGPDCFHDLAKFKRVYKIELTDENAGKPVRKIGHIDLMKIADPDKKAKKPLNDGVLTFPFFTIENVEVVDGTHIVVGNDNNLPFSSSRDPSEGRRQRDGAARGRRVPEGEVRLPRTPSTGCDAWPHRPAAQHDGAVVGPGATSVSLEVLGQAEPRQDEGRRVPGPKPRRRRCILSAGRLLTPCRAAWRRACAGSAPRPPA